MDKREIKAVFFDIGNVLLQFELKDVLRGFAWAVRSHPVKVARLLWSRKLVEGVERGKITPGELYTMFCRELDYKGDYRRFRRLWCEQFRVDRKVAGILRRVADQRAVYLLSNTNKLHYDYIRENFAFPRHVRGAILSYKLGLRKPEPAIYREALKRARIKAPNALFIDDLRENVASARKAGWNAIEFKGAQALERELYKYGLLI